MPVFLARWSDGSFSIAYGKDAKEAAYYIDEFGDEPIGMWQMEVCALDFELTVDGTFRLKDFGGQTISEIMGRCYPLLQKTVDDDEILEDHDWEGPPTGDPTSLGRIREAVSKECARKCGDPALSDGTMLLEGAGFRDFDPDRFHPDLVEMVVHTVLDTEEG
jgi:hypothetical protein